MTHGNLRAAVSILSLHIVCIMCFDISTKLLNFLKCPNKIIFAFQCYLSSLRAPNRSRDRSTTRCRWVEGSKGRKVQWNGCWWRQLTWGCTSPGCLAKCIQWLYYENIWKPLKTLHFWGGRGKIPYEEIYASLIVWYFKLDWRAPKREWSGKTAKYR